MAVGASYSGTSSGSSNGIIIEGNLGPIRNFVSNGVNIGTTSQNDTPLPILKKQINACRNCSLVEKGFLYKAWVIFQQEYTVKA